MESETSLSNIRSLRGGLNQSELRNLNERLLLSMIQRHGELPRSELAKISGLSAQTASVIIRKLESDGIVKSGKPIKGKVGKPSTPMTLARDGVYSIGLKIGRRSTELMLMDFSGAARNLIEFKYPYPAPQDILAFMETRLSDLTAVLSPAQQQRIIGIGVAAPHHLWQWHELLGASGAQLLEWKKVNLAREIGRFTDLKVSLVNDSTAACRAEHIYGRGKEFRDYGYFYIGTFVGGGVVLNNAVYEGNLANAGAFGALRTIGPDKNETTLIETASIHVLEKSLSAAGLDPDRLWGDEKDWSGIDSYLDPWIEQVGAELAKAALSICSVLDFEAVLIEGAFPSDIKDAIVRSAQVRLGIIDSRGLYVPQIEAGLIGEQAKVLGAASGPIFNHFFLSSNFSSAVE